MARLALALALALHLGLTTGESPSFGAAPCTEQCPDDDAQGKCAPDCADCVCCPHLGAITLTAAVKLVPHGAHALVVPHPPAPPGAPEPGEISHVPIHLA